MASSWICRDYPSCFAKEFKLRVARSGHQGPWNKLQFGDERTQTNFHIETRQTKQNQTKIAAKKPIIIVNIPPKSSKNPRNIKHPKKTSNIQKKHQTSKKNKNIVLAPSPLLGVLHISGSQATCLLRRAALSDCDRGGKEQTRISKRSRLLMFFFFLCVLGVFCDLKVLLFGVRRRGGVIWGSAWVQIAAKFPRCPKNKVFFFFFKKKQLFRVPRCLFHSRWAVLCPLIQFHQRRSNLDLGSKSLGDRRFCERFFLLPKRGF